MDQQLTANASSGLQGNSHSPQNATAPSGQAAPASNIQSGSSLNVLNSQSGIKLSTIPSSTATTASAQVPVKTTSHKFNLGLLAIPLVLILLAIVLIWLTKRAANNTTID